MEERQAIAAELLCLAGFEQRGESFIASEDLSQALKPVESPKRLSGNVKTASSFHKVNVPKIAFVWPSL